jgi:hypothetical protein
MVAAYGMKLPRKLSDVVMSRRGVNDIFLLIYSIRIVFNKMNMNKFFFGNLFNVGNDKIFFR